MLSSFGESRRPNASALRASESMFAEMQRQQESASARRLRQAQQDEALAAELDRRKREEESRRREIQRICEADPELRALQEKLKVRDSSCYCATVVVVWPLQRFHFPSHLLVSKVCWHSYLAFPRLQMAYVTKERLDQKKEREQLSAVR